MTTNSSPNCIHAICNVSLKHLQMRWYTPYIWVGLVMGFNQ